MELYNNCRELPIHNFFEISRSQDYRFLIKNGEYNEGKTEELQQKFIEIIDEYNSYFKDKGGAVHSMFNKNKLVSLSIKLEALHILEFFISEQGITEEIKEVCESIKIPPERIKSFIFGVKNEIKKLEHKIQQEEENEIHTGSADLERTLILVKENGFQFDRYRTPIIEFVYALNRLEEKAQQMESKA